MKNSILIALILSLTCSLCAQESINDYKYVVVPIQYEFLNGKDQYRLNTLTKFLFKSEGFDTYFDVQDLPEDLFENRCLAMYVNTLETKSFLNTILQIELKDCRGNVIITSKEGKTKEKSYKAAYNIALREAFESFKGLNHKYSPIQPTSSKLTETNPKVLQTKNLIAKQQKLEQPKTEALTTKPIVNPIKANSETIYYAQQIENGYQLVDATPKVLMVLLTTASDTIFIVKDKNAVVFKLNNQWLYSENSNGKVSNKVLNVKF